MKKEIYLSLIIIFFIITLKSTLLSGTFNHHTFVYADKSVTVHLKNYPLSAAKRFELEKDIYKIIKNIPASDQKTIKNILSEFLSKLKCREYSIKPVNQTITAEP